MVQITSDIELSGAGCTTAITPNQLVQSSSENDNLLSYELLRKWWFVEQENKSSALSLKNLIYINNHI
ncbi:Transposase protein InsA [Salmonella enterica]|nr:Transposase protein InsA [Salmonella enterica]